MTNNDDLFVVGIITLPYVYAKHSRLNMKTLSLYKKLFIIIPISPLMLLKTLQILQKN